MGAKIVGNPYDAYYIEHIAVPSISPFNVSFNFFIGGLSISGRDSMIEAKRSAVEMSCEIVLGMGFLTLVAMLLLH